MAIIVFHNDNLLKHLIIECIWPYSESTSLEYLHSNKGVQHLQDPISLSL